MARFLTQEWIDVIVPALNDSADVQGATSQVQLTIQQVITGGDPETKYWTKIDDGHVEAGLGDAATPDVTIAQDYDTAVAITRGELNAQAAFMQGKLKVTGNMGKLLQHQAAMQALFPVLGSLPTEY